MLAPRRRGDAAMAYWRRFGVRLAEPSEPCMRWSSRVSSLGAGFKFASLLRAHTLAHPRELAEIIIITSRQRLRVIK